MYTISAFHLPDIKHADNPPPTPHPYIGDQQGPQMDSHMGPT